MSPMFHFNGWWIIPMVFCIIMMFFMFSGRRRGFGPWFMTQETGERNFSPKTSESALDILKKRYAKGEISKSEYEEMRNDLS